MTDRETYNRLSIASTALASVARVIKLYKVSYHKEIACWQQHSSSQMEWAYRGSQKFCHPGGLALRFGSWWTL